MTKVLDCQLYASGSGNFHPGAAVKTSMPVSVTSRVSSNCAEAFPSQVDAAHH